MGLAEVAAVPRGAGGVAKNKLSWVNRALETAQGGEPGTRLVPTGGVVSDNDIGLFGRVTFGAVQQPEQESAGAGWEPMTGSCVGRDDLDIRPAEAKKLASTDPREPEEEFSNIGAGKSKAGVCGSSGVRESGLPVGDMSPRRVATART